MNRRARISGIAVTLVVASALLLTTRPSFATTLFALLNTGEVYSSTSGAVAWSAVGSIPVRDAVGLAAATSTSDLYLASQSGTVYHSANGGSAWTAVGAVTASDAAALTIRPDGGILVLTRTAHSTCPRIRASPSRVSPRY